VSISIFLPSLYFVRVLNRVLSPFSDGTVVELLEGEDDEDDDTALNTRQWVVVVFWFCCYYSWALLLTCPCPCPL
jgi:hypothetical protein